MACTTDADCPFIVYGKPNCPACGVAVRQLQSKGIQYDYRDVTQDPAYEARVRELGYQGVPVFEDGDQHFPMGDRFRDALASRVSQKLAPRAA